MSADTSKLLAYAQHIGSAVDRAQPPLTKVVARSATNITTNARARIDALTEGTYLPHYPKSLGWNMVGPLAAEVGPDSSKPQGGMGRGIEFGSANTGPKPHLFPAADAEEFRFGDQVALVFERALR